MLTTQLVLDSGRTATLTAERLQTMIDGYYAARGLDAVGAIADSDRSELLLDG
jgi:aldehyde:ferredoxin oxidoreductase